MKSSRSPRLTLPIVSCVNRGSREVDAGADGFLLRVVRVSIQALPYNSRVAFTVSLG